MASAWPQSKPRDRAFCHTWQSGTPIVQVLSRVLQCLLGIWEQKERRQGLWLHPIFWKQQWSLPARSSTVIFHLFCNMVTMELRGHSDHTSAFPLFSHSNTDKLPFSIYLKEENLTKSPPPPKKLSISHSEVGGGGREKEDILSRNMNAFLQLLWDSEHEFLILNILSCFPHFHRNHSASSEFIF